MAYDEALAERVRSLLDRPGYREQKMFGGVAMMLEANMAVAVLRSGLLVRVDPVDWEDLMTLPGAKPFEMGQQRVPRGWVVVDPGALDDDATLGEWVARGVDFVSTLPPK